MKKAGVGILVVVLYCFPFVFFSMYLDFAHQSMVGYLMMIIATFLLAFFGQYYCNFIPIIMGNVLTTVLSLYFNNGMANFPRWSVIYFTPFSPTQLLIIVSILNTIPQLIAVFVAINLKVRKRTKETNK